MAQTKTAQRKSAPLKTSQLKTTRLVPRPSLGKGRIKPKASSAAAAVPPPATTELEDDDEVLDIPLTEDAAEPEQSQPASEASQPASDVISFDAPKPVPLAPPALASVAPLYRPRWTVERILLILTTCAAVVLAVLLLLAKAHSGAGKLAVTVQAPAGVQVDGLQVAIDGQPRCESSPCLVEGLPDGRHVVQVSAPGFEPTAEQETTLEYGTKTHLVVRLLRDRGSVVPRVAAAAPKPKPSASLAPPGSAEVAQDAAPEGSAQAIASAATSAPPRQPPARPAAKAVAASRSKGGATKSAAASKGKSTSWLEASMAAKKKSKAKATTSKKSSNKKKKKKKKKKTRKLRLQ